MEAQGPTGEQGNAGGLLGHADFYATMPSDNAATIAPGTDINFPNKGGTSGNSITRINNTTFSLNEIGTYLIIFKASITEAGQLVLTN